MAKIKLGQRPKSFKRTVKFPMLDGSEGAIEVTYRYRTRAEYGDFLDDWRKRRQDALTEEAAERQKAREAAISAGEEPPPESFNTGDTQRKIAEATADFIVQIAEGWNLDEEFTIESIQQLANELPAAAAAIQDTYLIAITEGRLGN